MLAMEPEELGGILLRIASVQLQQGMFQPKNVVDSRGVPFETVNLPESSFSLANPRPPKYPAELAAEVDAATAEGWNWLVLNGFIMPAPGINGNDGWRMLTKKGTKEVEDRPVAHVTGAAKASTMRPSPPAVPPKPQLPPAHTGPGRGV